MRSKNWQRNSAVLAVSLCLAAAASSQRGTKAAPLPSEVNTPAAPLVMQDTEPFPSPNAKDDTPLAVLARQARLQAEDREKHLKADTARLVELSTLLQAEVNRAGSHNVLSLENLRRTEEIEKLARKVRERMKS